jgi:hypothetical protein
MADSSIFWLRVAAVLYAMGLLHSMLAILKRRNDFYGFALGAFRVGVSWWGSIVELAVAGATCLWKTSRLHKRLRFPDCAISVRNWRYHFASTSIALFPLAFLMTLVAGMRQPVSAWSDVRVRMRADRAYHSGAGGYACRC